MKTTFATNRLRTSIFRTGLSLILSSLCFVIFFNGTPGNSAFDLGNQLSELQEAATTAETEGILIGIFNETATYTDEKNQLQRLGFSPKAFSFFAEQHMAFKNGRGGQDLESVIKMVHAYSGKKPPIDSIILFLTNDASGSAGARRQQIAQTILSDGGQIPGTFGTVSLKKKRSAFQAALFFVWMNDVFPIPGDFKPSTDGETANIIDCLICIMDYIAADMGCGNLDNLLPPSACHQENKNDLEACLGGC